MTADPVIHDRDGRPGVLDSRSDERLRIRLPDGGLLEVPAGLAREAADGSLLVDVSFADLRAEAPIVLTEVEERLRVDRVVRDRQRVVARTVTDAVTEPVDAAGWRQTVEVERVPVGRVVDAVEGVRVEGDVTIVPVYEEVLVVRTQLVLREEVRLTTRRESVPGPEHVTLRRQRVEVDRLPPDDAAGLPGE